MSASQLAPEKRHQFTHEGRVVYEWDQSFQEVNLYVTVPPGIRGKDLKVDIQSDHIRFGIVGKPPYIDHALSSSAKVSESFWTLGDHMEAVMEVGVRGAEDDVLHITLQKLVQGQSWTSAIRGHELDAATADNDQRRLMLERFQLEHPGFDFSQAEFNGAVPDPATFMGGASLK